MQRQRCHTPVGTRSRLALPWLYAFRAARGVARLFRRVGTASDVAAVILFLASPMADYLNGVTIDVNGGSWFQ